MRNEISISVYLSSEYVSRLKKAGEQLTKYIDPAFTADDYSNYDSIKNGRMLGEKEKKRVKSYKKVFTADCRILEKSAKLYREFDTMVAKKIKTTPAYRR